MQAHSLNITEDVLAQLKQIIPAAFTEDKLNIDQLKQLLGEDINTDNERYHLDWAGKAEAFKVLQSPTTATLLPDAAASVDWDNAQNILIEGENLEALKALQKSYYGKVKMVYIDPPYNTGGDSFIYPDKFSETKEEYLRRIGDKDEEGYLMKEGFFRKNNKENGQFHSNWLNMMMPRLFLARNLLRDDGVIFISIDDNEVHNLRMLMNEIFGEENFVAEFPRITKKAGKTTETVAKNNDYLLCYRKSNESFFNSYELNDDGYRLEDEFLEERGKYKLSQTLDYGSIQYSQSLDYPIELEGKLFIPGSVSIEEMQERKKRNPKSDFCWRWSRELFDFGLQNGFVVVKTSRNGSRIYTKTYEQAIISEDGNGYYVDIVGRSKSATTLQFIENEFSNDNSKKDIGKIFSSKVFEYSKPVSLIKSITYLASSDDSIILDFFAGSGTTAQAVMELNEADGGNRKYICIQLPEKTDESSEAYKAGYKSIADITEARIKKVIEKIQAQRGSEMQFEEKQSLGFRKFTLAPSSFKLWRGDVAANEEELQKQMDLFATAQKASAQTQNMLWELLLKNGMPLTAPVQKHTLADDATIYTAADKRLAFVLDKYTGEVQPKLLELRPQTAIFLDSLFKGQDQAKTNLQLKLEESGITFKTI